MYLWIICSASIQLSVICKIFLIMLFTCLVSFAYVIHIMVRWTCSCCCMSRGRYSRMKQLSLGHQTHMCFSCCLPLLTALVHQYTWTCDLLTIVGSSISPRYGQMMVTMPEQSTNRVYMRSADVILPAPLWREGRAIHPKSCRKMKIMYSKCL